MRKLPFGVVLTPAQIAYYEELLQLIRELRARERELRAIRDASSCVALLNAARQFLVSGPALHGVQIEGGKVTRDELASLISAALGEHGWHDLRREPRQAGTGGLAYLRPALCSLRGSGAGITSAADRMHVRQNCDF
jgi:hypothetical protein